MPKSSKSDRRKYLCKYCQMEFHSKEECKFHEENECYLNPNLLKDKSTWNFILFIITSTFKVAGLAFLVITPALLYLSLLHVPSRYGYIALAVFWIVLFGVITALASAVDYLRKRGRKSHKN